MSSSLARVGYFPALSTRYIITRQRLIGGKFFPQGCCPIVSNHSWSESNSSLLLQKPPLIPLSQTANKLWSSPRLLSWSTLVPDLHHDLPFSLQKSHVMYADDTAISLSSKSIGDLQNDLNLDLLKLQDWLHANKLSLNVVKT